MKKSRGKHSRLTAVVLAALLSVLLLPAGAFAEDQMDESVVDGSLSDVTVSIRESCGPGNHTIDPVKDYYELVEATCAKDGTKAHYQCEICKVNCEDAEGLHEISDADLVIPATGKHTWDEGVVKVKKSRFIRLQKCIVCKKATRETVLNNGRAGKKFKLDDCRVQFKEYVLQVPPSYMKNANIDHVWIRTGKTNIKVYWDNAKKMSRVDGVVILRKAGKESVYKEVGRLAFRKKDGSVKIKNVYNDKTAKKKNTPYTYRAVTYYVDKKGVTVISHISDWASGQTSRSKLRSSRKAKISDGSLYMQYGESSTLSMWYSNSSKVYKSRSFRWYSDKTKVAAVNTKGRVKAKAPGTTLVRGRMASGYDKTCKVRIVGAYKPGTPAIKVDVASNHSITLMWNDTNNANGFDLYQSNDGLHWKKPMYVRGTTKKVTGLTKGHRYTFYVVARNDNGPYTAYSDSSNVVYQKAVVKRRPTKVSGWPTSKRLISGESYTMKIYVSTPERRTAKLQMKNGGSWITKKYVTLPGGTGSSSLFIRFPNDWWYQTSNWRLVIPRNSTSTEYTSKTLKITAERRYQNPRGYVQISDSISKHGYSYYTSPVLVDGSSTRTDHVEALIKTARKYLGDSYLQSSSGAPGYGIDESGLVIQSCYGAGVDLWPISPATRKYNCVPTIMDSDLQYVKFKNAEEGSDNYPGTNRGDLVFFKDKDGNLVHVAIYLGWGQIIHASPVEGSVETSTIRELTDEEGAYGYKVAGVRRIFVFD